MFPPSTQKPQHKAVNFAAAQDEDEDELFEASFNAARLPPIRERSETLSLANYQSTPSEIIPKLAASFAVTKPSPVALDPPVPSPPASPLSKSPPRLKKGVSFKLPAGVGENSEDDLVSLRAFKSPGSPSIPRRTVMFKLAPGQGKDDEEEEGPPSSPRRVISFTRYEGNKPQLGAKYDPYGRVLDSSYHSPGEHEQTEAICNLLTPFAAPEIQRLGCKSTPSPSDLSPNASSARVSPRGSSGGASAGAGDVGTHQEFFAPFAAANLKDLQSMYSLPKDEEEKAIEPQSPPIAASFVRLPHNHATFFSPFSPDGQVKQNLTDSDFTSGSQSPSSSSDEETTNCLQMQIIPSGKLQNGFSSPFQASNLPQGDFKWPVNHSKGSSPSRLTPYSSKNLQQGRSGGIMRVQSRCAQRAQQASFYLLDLAFTADPANIGSSRSQPHLSIDIPVMPASIYEYSIAKKPSFEEERRPPHSYMFIIITLAIELSLAGVGVAGYYLAPG